MIKIENVSKAFREKIVLSKISFTANEGEVTALIGPNGSGKSTLGKSIVGVNKLTSGKILYDEPGAGWSTSNGGVAYIKGMDFILHCYSADKPNAVTISTDSKSGKAARNH